MVNEMPESCLLDRDDIVEGEELLKVLELAKKILNRPNLRREDVFCASALAEIVYVIQFKQSENGQCRQEFWVRPKGNKILPMECSDS
ncbi:uncharacterized protein LOC119661614 isoform X2 [Hermetia illucens]|uniref:uncharacterized protein LOC119661614 isoform X2 n=1 Tax=Hermetia illucens TaxID=343691 RepID=UPI0018CC1B6F|nr:uncharacterized protein LOC119661614 isoform X2 [Hermetia illucens]